MFEEEEEEVEGDKWKVFHKIFIKKRRRKKKKNEKEEILLKKPPSQCFVIIAKR